MTAIDAIVIKDFRYAPECYVIEIGYHRIRKRKQNAHNFAFHLQYLMVKPIAMTSLKLPSQEIGLSNGLTMSKIVLFYSVNII